MKPVFKQPDEYIKPEGNIDSMTSYKKEYTPKDVAPAKPIKRNDGRRVQGKFEGDPTYRCKYNLRSWSPLQADHVHVSTYR